MRKVLKALSLTAVLLFTTGYFNGASDSGYPPGTELSYYTIDGDSPEELHAALNNSGLRDQFGRVRWAVTRWRIKWILQEQPKSVDVSCAISVVLPKRRCTECGSSADHRRWTRFIQAMSEHEQQHARNGYTAAREIEKTLESLIARNPNIEFRELDRAARDVVRAAQNWDVSFDSATEHGKNEGVHL